MEKKENNRINLEYKQKAQQCCRVPGVDNGGRAMVVPWWRKEEGVWRDEENKRKKVEEGKGEKEKEVTIRSEGHK